MHIMYYGQRAFTLYYCAHGSLCTGVGSDRLFITSLGVAGGSGVGTYIYFIRGVGVAGGSGVPIWGNER